MIDICDVPPIENGLHNVCLAPAVPFLSFTFTCAAHRFPNTNCMSFVLRWYLLKLKSKAVKCSRRTSLVDEMRPQHFEEERECKLVEEVLTVRQMTKALAVSNLMQWWDSASSRGFD